jgi:hypothetical protein
MKSTFACGGVEEATECVSLDGEEVAICNYMCLIFQIYEILTVWFGVGIANTLANVS